MDFSTTQQELQDFFQSCGTVVRVTIRVNKITGKPKGYAYVMFAEPEAIPNALLLNESLFKGRILRVTTKRTNVPRFTGGRGGGGGGGGPRGYYGSPRGMRPMRGHRGGGRWRGF